MESFLFTRVLACNMHYCEISFLCIFREIYAIGVSDGYNSPSAVYPYVYQYKIEQDMWVVKNLQQPFHGKARLARIHL